MSVEAYRMMWVAGAIGLLVVLISAIGLHPFLALLTAALVLDLGFRLPFPQMVSEFQKGFADVMWATSAASSGGGSVCFPRSV